MPAVSTVNNCVNLCMYVYIVFILIISIYISPISIVYVQSHKLEKAL